MSVSTVHVRVEYPGNDATTAFPITFQFGTASDLLVTLIDADGAETAQYVTTNFTVVKSPNGTGTLTMLVAPPTGSTLRIVRSTAKVQPDSLRNQGQFYPETVEAMIDRNTRQIQESEYNTILGEYTLLTEEGLPIIPDWWEPVGGGGSGDVAASDVTITDAGSHYTATNVESALQEVASVKAPKDASYVVIGSSSDLTDGRVLTAGSGITLTDGGAGGALTIAATGGGGGGEVNTASNIGTGYGQVFAYKVGADLQFRTIKAGSNTTVSMVGSEIVIDSAASDFQQGGTGATTRVPQDKMRERVSLADYISAADLNSAVTRSSEIDIYAPLTNAISYLTSIGGGEIYIPAGKWKLSQTLIINDSSVDIIGAGGDGNHDATSPDTGTTIRWRGSDLGEAIRVQSKGLSGSPTLSGGSLRNIKISGGTTNTLGTGLLVASVRGWVFENITVYDAYTRGVYLTVQSLGAEARDTQKCLFRHVTLRLLSPGGTNAVGFELAGDSGANASFNIFEHCDVLHQNGAGYKLVTADNNLFVQCRAFRPSGSGRALEVHGNNTAGFECNSNTFYGFSPSSGGVKLFGTTTYTVPSKMTVFYAYDMANGSPMPTVETGASWHMHKSNGATYNDYLVAPTFGVDDSAVDTHRAARGSESMRVYNFSANHARYLDGSGNEWAVRIDGSGNFEMLRISGAGSFKVQSPAMFSGNVGFYGATPAAKPAVSGSRGGNAAIASLITGLANLGLVDDSTSA